MSDADGAVPRDREAAMETAWKAGLEDVIAARSGICRVDGERGRLYYRGYEIGELAGALSFEDVTALLWHGELPAAAESAAFASRLEAARGLDLVLTLHADHELNASTFAARVGVATLTDLHAAIVAAVATLKGPRHGGANEDVLAMLLEIGEPARARACSAAWRSRWRRRPAGRSSSRWPSVSTTRCGPARPCP